MKEAIFSTAYFPSIEYFSALMKFNSVEIEQCENFQKQTLRNRCFILSANGVLMLSIPVLHSGKNKVAVKDIRICYDDQWQRVHWAALFSAYNKSPFFEFYRDDFEKIIFSNETFLLDLNMSLLQLLLKILHAGIEISLTDTFKIDSSKPTESDFRFLSDQKKNLSSRNEVKNPVYPQVFSYKFSFTPGLSIIDLIFNKGNESKDYLESL